MPPESIHPEQSPLPKTEDLLHRIVTAMEKNGKRGGLELSVAIILSLATLASTWCGYQANQWGGIQRSKQAAADTAERQAAENTIVGLQMRTYDVLEVREYWVAVRSGDTKTRDTVFAHMRPQLQKAVEASLNAGILENPQLPGPLQRPEYVLVEEQKAKRLRAESQTLQKEAHTAGQASADYVSLTLMFASVLFFGGITGTFTVRRVRIGLGIVALVLFLVTVTMLIGLPVSRG